MTGNFDHIHYRCAVCGATYEVTLDRFTCDCTGVLDLEFDAPAFPSSLVGRSHGLTRYVEALAMDAESLAAADLGSGRTPLLTMGESTYAKCDYIMPSGSFKDRGAQVLAALALRLGANSVVVDSSGNAGAAMAAHCARLGIDCIVVAPSSAPAAKLYQSRVYGADVRLVEGPRSAATTVALELSSRDGTLYASHVENPFFTDGTKAWSFEVWEQLGDAPAQVVMSVGNGSLFIGAYLGFRYLLEHGFTSRIPKMVAAQAVGWSALAGDLSHGGELPVADGIAIVAPRRFDQIKKIIDVTGGEVRTVTPDVIKATVASLARDGLWVEPTSAVAWAAAEQGPKYDDGVVVSLGGAGFKSSVD